MNVIILGGNGFIGSHLSERLIATGHSVTLYDQTFNSNTSKLACEKVRGDITDYPSLRKALNGKDVVFHFAALSRVIWGQQNPLTCWQINLMGTLNVLEACRRMRHKPVLFYASSREVYGEPQYLPVDEGHPKNPISIYGLSKLHAEKACLSYQHTFGFDGVIFRFSNVYGSERDQLDRVVPKFMLQALRNEDLTLYGGDQILDFNFIDDTVSGIMDAYITCLNGDQPIAGEDFHFVTGRGASVSELANMIVDLVHPNSKIVRKAAKNYDVQKFIGNPTKCRQMIGYKATTRLEDGLKQLYEQILPYVG